MNLSQTIIDEARARASVRVPDGGDIRLIPELLKKVTGEIEEYLDRLIISRGTITELHSFTGKNKEPHELRLCQYPVLSSPTPTIHESTLRVFDSTTLLVASTDYYINTEDGIITRVSGDQPIAWTSGWENVQIVYAGGYSKQAQVPEGLQGIVAEYFAMHYFWETRQLSNYTQQSDGFGSRTMLPPRLSEGMKERLNEYHSGGRSSTFERSTTA